MTTDDDDEEEEEEDEDDDNQDYILFIKQNLFSNSSILKNHWFM